MEDYLKTLWHCTTHLHRLCWYRAAGTVRREYFCECSGRLEEILELV